MKRYGCCVSCRGTGYSGDQAVPGGACWDCRGTGHSHLGWCPITLLVRLYWAAVVALAGLVGSGVVAMAALTELRVTGAGWHPVAFAAAVLTAMAAGVLAIILTFWDWPDRRRYPNQRKASR